MCYPKIQLNFEIPLLEVKKNMANSAKMAKLFGWG